MSISIHYLNKIIITVPGPAGKPVISDIRVSQVTIKWTPPSLTGDSPVTGYVVECRRRNDRSINAWEIFRTEEVECTSHTMTGLEDGTSYKLTICAVNRTGRGSQSESSDVVVTKSYGGRYGIPHVVSILSAVNSYRGFLTNGALGVPISQRKLCHCSICRYKHSICKCRS